MTMDVYAQLQQRVKRGHGAPFDRLMLKARHTHQPRPPTQKVGHSHDYIETWHNTKRRHSTLNIFTPTEYENQHQQQIAA